MTALSPRRRIVRQAQRASVLQPRVARRGLPWDQEQNAANRNAVVALNYARRYVIRQTPTMLPETWLKERLETTDMRELSARELRWLDLSPAVTQEFLTRGASPAWLEKWKVFISQMQPGDELWRFESPPETWGNLAGRAGYAIVRSGKITDCITSLKN